MIPFTKSRVVLNPFPRFHTTGFLVASFNPYPVPKLWSGLQGIQSVFYHLMTALGACGCAAGILGWALRGPPLLSRGKWARTLNMFQQAAFPVYVLHQVVLIVVAEYFALHLPLGAHSQLVVLILVGFSASIVLYALTNALPVFPYLAFGRSWKGVRGEGKQSNYLNLY